jgi:hypothetical protein
MSNLRVFWIAWCSAWALGWLLLGFFTLVTWLFVPLSLAALLLPVGCERRPPPPLEPWRDRQLPPGDRM